MQKQHILIERSFRFPVQTDTSSRFEGVHYRRDIGAWVTNDDPNQLMVTEVIDQNQPRPRPRPQSKKADLETGEDMKGE